LASLYSGGPPSLYDLVGDYIRTRPWPRGFDYDVYENDQTLTFVMFQDNIDSFSGDAKEQLKVLLMGLAELNKNGIPIRPVVKPSRRDSA